MSPEPARSSAIHLGNLSKAFGDQVVLKDVSLDVGQGETLLVLGRSGTGKSVLLRLLIGLQRPDSGTIRMAGEEVVGLAEGPLNALRTKVGFVFQNAALYDSLSVVENVAFPLRYNTDKSASQRRDRAMDLLSKVGMEAAAAKLPTDLSGGMRKRVGLARALALEPEIMLYDEPTAGLDPITSAEINALILALQQERAMSSIVVTHDLRSAEAISDHVALLNEGCIVFEGTFEAFRASQDPFVARFVGNSSMAGPGARHG